MNRYLTLGAVLVGGVAAGRALARAPRRRPGPALGGRMLRHMGQVLQSLPPDSPPRLIMSTLPRLQEQNEQIIALLHEQNALLRQRAAMELPAS